MLSEETLDGAISSNVVLAMTSLFATLTLNAGRNEWIASSSYENEIMRVLVSVM